VQVSVAIAVGGRPTAIDEDDACLASAEIFRGCSAHPTGDHWT
jgi:hypothetical protein